MIETIALAFIILAAGFLQGLTGFGFVLIALPLLDMFIPLKTIIPLVCLLALFISLTLSIQLRKAIVFSNIALLFAATVPAIPIGVYVLKHVPPQYLGIALGLLMISFTAYQLLANPVPRHLGHPWTVLAGFLSGVLGASIGAGGPPVIIYSATQPWEKDRAKGTLAFYFLVSGAMVSSMHAASGLITREVLRLFVLSLPSMFIGILIGLYAYSRLSDAHYRKLAFVLVLGLGCMLLYNNLTVGP